MKPLARTNWGPSTWERIHRWSKFAKGRAGQTDIRFLRHPPSYISAYHNYCMRGVADAMNEIRCQRPVWLVLPEDIETPPKRSKRIVLQLEHTLVAPGGRGVGSSPVGSVPLIDGQDRYHVRLEGGVKRYEGVTGIIEYSRANVANVLSSELADVYRGRVEYIAPLLSGLPPSLAARSKLVIATMHGSPEKGRRGAIRQELLEAGRSVRNIEGVWMNYGPVFDEIAILVNVHQTEHHHTLEELRILSAVERGVIVVTEEVPLINTVPYRDFLVVAPYGRLAETVDRIAEQYEAYWKRLFGGGRLRDVHDDMVAANRQAFLRLANCASPSQS